MIVYGIKNCDTTQKAIKMLVQYEADFEFHDYKQKGIDRESLQRWIKQVGVEKVLNKKSATWRSLSEADQKKTLTEAGAVAVMQANTNLIKRPLIEAKGKVIAVAFSEEAYLTFLS